MKYRIGAALIALAAAFSAMPAAAQMKKVTFSTDIGFNGRHALFFVAQEKGYFKDEGLDVEIRNGKGSGAVVKEVAAGTIDIAFADAGVLVMARGNEDVEVKLVSVIYADSPLAYFFMEDSDIKTPKDLEGRTIADNPGGANSLLFPAFAQKAGIDPSKIKFVNADGSTFVGLLLSGQVDAVGQFFVGLPLFNKRAEPRKVAALAFRDVGIHYYSNGLVVHENKLASDPDMVKSFVRAVQRGMKDAFADPKAAGAILAKHQRQIDAEIGEGETALVRDLAKQPDEDKHGIGYLDRDRVAETISLISEYFKLQRPVTVDEVIAPGFVAPL